MTITLPRGYLSWSAMTTWESNKERFKREYFEGGKRLDTKFLRFGKSFAKSVEDGTYKKDFPDLPIYNSVEFKFHVDIDGVMILGFIDSYDTIKNLVLEYKTGKHPWTKAKVQKHGQLAFYATALEALTGTMPEYAELIWLETKEDKSQKMGLYNGQDERIEFTGKSQVFKRKFDKREVVKMRERIKKNALEISDAYAEFINNLEL